MESLIYYQLAKFPSQLSLPFLSSLKRSPNTFSALSFVGSSELLVSFYPLIISIFTLAAHLVYSHHTRVELRTLLFSDLLNISILVYGGADNIFGS